MMTEMTSINSGEPSQNIALRWWILVVVQLGTFMCTFDAGVVNLALPVIRGEFGCSIAAIKWVSVIYTATAALGLPLGAFFGRRFGTVRMYKIGLCLFTIGTVGSGFTHDLYTLYALRFVAACGAVPMLALNKVILMAVFPKEQHGRALGFSATTFGIGIISGLAAGGLLIHVWGWRSIFLVNLPFGLAAIGLSVYHMKSALTQALEDRGISFDWKGLLWMAAALGTTMMAMTHWLDKEHDVNIYDVVSLLLCPFAVWGWLRHEWRHKETFLHLNLLKQKPLGYNFSVGFCVRIVMGGVNFAVPFYLQDAIGLSPLQAGALLAVGALTMGIIGPFAGALTDRWGPVRTAFIGLALMGMAMVVYAFLPGSISQHHQWILVMSMVIGGQMLIGAGSIFFSAANMVSCMHGVHDIQRGAVSSLLSVNLMAGTALGSTLAGDLITFLQGLQSNVSSGFGQFPPQTNWMLFGVDAILLISLVIIAAERLKKQHGEH